MSNKLDSKIIKELYKYTECLECSVHGHPCDENCPTQYEAGNMGTVIKNLKTVLEYLDKEHKSAHWIRQKSMHGYTHSYECSECGRVVYEETDDLSDYPYCHCGCRMEGVKE